MKDKESLPNVISAYRRHKERFEQLLPFFWIGVMSLVVGAGYLIYTFLLPHAPVPVPNSTQTLAPTETVSPGTPAATTPAPAAIELQNPTETPPGEAPAATSVSAYTIQAGDTLAGIAKRFGVRLPDLIALNPLVTPEFLKIGDQLSIPAQGRGLAGLTPTAPGFQSMIEYKVVSGDTLAAIAGRFGSTIDAIVRENNLESPDMIQEGQTLKIPVEAGASPSATPGQPSSTPETVATPTAGGYAIRRKYLQ